MSIKQIQRALGVTVDGVWGSQSKAALRQAMQSGIDTKVSTNFFMSELTHSNTAVRLGMENTPNDEHAYNLIQSTLNLWQPTRDLLGQPMLINSGYRAPAVNNRVGGSKTSAHSFGFAIDFTCPCFGNTRKIAAFLAAQFKAKGIKYDQIILEFPDSASSWIHLGYKNRNGEQRGQVLTAKKVNGKTQYFNGLM